jgi:hypothetical protein
VRHADDPSNFLLCQTPVLAPFLEKVTPAAFSPHTERHVTGSFPAGTGLAADQCGIARAGRRFLCRRYRLTCALGKAVVHTTRWTFCRMRMARCEDAILSANSETCISASETAFISASTLSRIDFSRFGA